MTQERGTHRRHFVAGKQSFPISSVLVLAAALIMGSAAVWRSGWAAPAAADDGYSWLRLTAAADYPKSYNFQMFADSAHVRAFHPGGVWVSDDGVTWKKSPLTNILGNQAFLDYVYFRGAVYALGTFEGNIERHSQSSQIARTTDFQTWEIVAGKSNLPNRFFYHPFVFRDTLWIIGGATDDGNLNDAWQSVDAVHWTKVMSELPFGPRAGVRFTVFRDSLYMLDHDAWVSGDGRHWRQATKAIAGGEIFGYSVEVFDDAIWLVGCNRNGSFRSEVLRSRDGVVWTAQRAPWSPRGGVATCMFQGNLLMTGGKYGGPGIAGQTEFVYSNDVWTCVKR